ncbi:MAG: hypothetical protein U0136_01235 [Bdellovibrionota bacterium]
MKKRILLAILALYFFAHIPPDARSETSDFVINAEGFDWHYSVFVPSSYQQLKSLPLVIVLHGAGGRGPVYLEKAGWALKAEREGFLVAAPTGLPARPSNAPHFLTNPNLWNTGASLGLSPRRRIDDVAFFRKLIAELESRYHVDPSAVFLTGHSNGAGMTFALAARMSDTFRAVAPVMGVDWEQDVHLKRPVPTLYIVGTDDPLVPFAGGKRRTPWSANVIPPVQKSVDAWARALGCSTNGQPSQVSGDVTLIRYCSSERDLFRFYVLKGQGHEWPGATRMLPERMTGPSITGFSATDVIWEFFEHHLERNEKRPNRALP